MMVFALPPHRMFKSSSFYVYASFHQTFLILPHAYARPLRLGNSGSVCILSEVVDVNEVLNPIDSMLAADCSRTTIEEYVLVAITMVFVCVQQWFDEFMFAVCQISCMIVLFNLL